MRIKVADDKSRRLALLNSLQDSTQLDERQKKWLDSELWALKEGVRGERDAAHYLDNHFARDENLAVIHDLRLELEGEVAQIDHLLISRGFVFYLLETKQYNGDLHINEFGEFSVSYGNGKPRGLPCPLEQSRRHQNVLRKLLTQLGISGRTQKEPDFRHVILVNPSRNIHRPAKGVFDTHHVIKADQFASWREKYVQSEVGVMRTLHLMMNMRATSTVTEWAKLICRHHQPQDLLALPDFMKPQPLRSQSAPASPQVTSFTTPASVEGVQPRHSKPVSGVCAECAKPLTAAVQDYCRNRVAMFDGLLLCMEHQQSHIGAAKSGVDSQAQPTEVVGGDGLDSMQRRLVCSACGVKISFAEGKYCWNNSNRFAGKQYCKAHQKGFRLQGA